MTPKTIAKIINQYFSGDIDRKELMQKAEELKPEFLHYDDYFSYDFLILDDIIRILTEIPELSYSDDQLVEILEVLENKRNIMDTYLFKIPNTVLEKDDIILIKIVDAFINNCKSNRTDEVKLCGESLISYIDKDELEFLNQLSKKLSNDDKETIVKTVELNIFSLLNYFGEWWKSAKSCFISVDDISSEFLLNKLERQLQILLGKTPVFVQFSGKISKLSVSLF